MKIDSEFSLPLAPDEAWRRLLDVPTIAPCVPGATLLEDLGNNRYRGKASVKLGPVQLQFTGEVAILEANEAQRTATVRARGNDRGGRGGADADIRFQLSGADGASHVKITTDLQLNGAIAQYGRAQGVLDTVAREIARQFADNLRTTLIDERNKKQTSAAEDLKSMASATPSGAERPANTLSLFRLIAAVVKSLFRRRADGPK